MTDSVLHKDRPLTRETVTLLNAYFAITAKQRPVPMGLLDALREVGVVCPVKVIPQP